MSKIPILCGLVVALSLTTGVATSQVYIQEYCSDPLDSGAPMGLDTNGDGIPAALGAQDDDEFIEIVNGSGTAVNISGWTFSDSNALRHVFDPNTVLPPASAIVVFGGGDLSFFNNGGIHGVVASLGNGLSLNNGGDSLFLMDSQGLVIDQQIYAGGGGPGDGDGTSSTRNPESSSGSFVHHINVSAAVFHSAGLHNNGSTPYGLPSLAANIYPGDASDADIEVEINGAPDNPLSNVHTVQPLDLIKMDLNSPNGTLIGMPFALAMQLFQTGSPVSPLQITGVFSIWLNTVGALGPPLIFLDGLTCTTPLCPVIVPGGVEIGALVPSNYGGLNLSVMVQLIVRDPGVNAPFDLGFSDAHEFAIQ